MQSPGRLRGSWLGESFISFDPLRYVLAENRLRKTVEDLLLSKGIPPHAWERPPDPYGRQTILWFLTWATAAALAVPLGISLWFAFHLQSLGVFVLLAATSAFTVALLLYWNFHILKKKLGFPINEPIGAYVVGDVRGGNPLLIL